MIVQVMTVHQMTRNVKKHILARAPNNDLNQPMHPSSLVRVSVVSIKVFAAMAYLNVPYQDSDQTEQMCRLF